MGNSKTTIAFVRNDLDTFIVNEWIIYKASLVKFYETW